jgi:hypothetical protein
MKRREFIKLLRYAAAVCLPPLPLLWPFAAGAQSPAGSNQPAGAPAGQASQVGQVATVQGTATVTRGNGAAAAALQVNDPVFKSDTLATGIDSALGVTFDDETTFSLSANTRIVVNEFVYQEGANGNAAAFSVAVGTAAFVASLVAKTGDMKITTPTATLGIRGTTGVVDVPQGAGGGEEPRIKLYPDTDGHVGQIDVFNPRGERLGALTQGGSAFAIQRGPGGSFRAVPFQIPPQEAARDRGVLQRLFVSHAVGRRMTNARIRSRGPGRSGPRQPGRFEQPLNRNPRGGGPSRSQPPRRGNSSERGRRQ